MKITWLGHACFLVEDAKGIKVITDPFAVDPQLFAERKLKFDYPPLTGVQADLVLISHEHFDHNAAGAVGGSPTVIREPGDFQVKGIPIRAVAGEHDPEGGRIPWLQSAAALGDGWGQFMPLQGISARPPCVRNNGRRWDKWTFFLYRWAATPKEDPPSMPPGRSAWWNCLIPTWFCRCTTPLPRLTSCNRLTIFYS